MNGAPLTLAIETSSPIGSVAIGRADQLLGETVLGVNSRHSELLLPAIDFLLHIGGVERSGLERIVIGGGPGSFTGLRIAAATAKGLAAALDLEVLAYSGLLATAAGTGIRNTAVCALFDARRDQVYAGCYRIADGINTMIEPVADSIDSVLEQIDARATVFAGDGALRHADRITARGGQVLPAHLGFPRASALLWLAQVAPHAGIVRAVEHWEPNYLRAANAERGVHG